MKKNNFLQIIDQMYYFIIIKNSCDGLMEKCNLNWWTKQGGKKKKEKNIYIKCMMLNCKLLKKKKKVRFTSKMSPQKKEK